MGSRVGWGSSGPPAGIPVYHTRGPRWGQTYTFTVYLDEDTSQNRRLECSAPVLQVAPKTPLPAVGLTSSGSGDGRRQSSSSGLTRPSLTASAMIFCWMFDGASS